MKYVHKFGGTSLGSPQLYKNISSILEQQEGPQCIVVSAMAGMTDALLNCCIQAAEKDTKYIDSLADIATKQYELLDYIDYETRQEKQQLQSELNDLKELLKGCLLIGQATNEMKDFVSGYGEKWSARALSAMLNSHGVKACSIDATTFLTVTASKQGKQVEWGETLRLYKKQLNESYDCVVVTGYVARDEQGRSTTLGRNGSDYSAAIMASLLDAKELTIWTDVDGVLSADPRRVPEARVLGTMSYDEAFELAYFGAKVIHPQTMASVIKKEIPVYIRNTFKPGLPGTRIALSGKQNFTVKGISSVDDLSLLNIEGTGMIGVPGTAEKVFRALHDKGVSVVMISQGSSEHSICVAVNENQSDCAQRILTEEFAAEIQQGKITQILNEKGISILALVGDAMTGQPGIAGRFLMALGQAGVNIRAIAQGSSERNISVAIRKKESTRALRAAHAAFYLSNQTYSIGIIGVGTVGGVLMDQLISQVKHIKQNSGIDIRVRGIANSRHMLIGDALHNNVDWRNELADSSEQMNLNKFTQHINAEHLPNHVIIDCTSSQTMADQYISWLEQGIHVITPNKKANSSDYSYYKELMVAGSKRGSQYMYETNVGAGLPIVQVLKDLINTGDEVHNIGGIFSGTMAYLFNKYDGETGFAALVKSALESGFTEPDPRDDLSGMDVARKLLILAREMGADIELDDVEVESLVPEKLVDVEKSEFMRSFAEYDDEMKSRYEKAKQENKVLRYVGSYSSESGAKVSLEAVDKRSAFAQIELTDNIVEFKTTRYCKNPLVVKGPGAGPEVTAGGVFADLLRVCHGLGARMMRR
ncbi:MAG: bifunctional aspartate kinase/homoserine dehydrogenase I [bacterium]